MSDYTVARKEYLKAHPACELAGCTARSDQIHHINGRNQGKLTNQAGFMAVCRTCHDWIHFKSPSKAREKGYLT